MKIKYLLSPTIVFLSAVMIQAQVEKVTSPLMMFEENESQNFQHNDSFSNDRTAEQGRMVQSSRFDDARFSLDQQRGSYLGEIVEIPKASAEEIFSRRYLNVNPDEFKTISGESRGMTSQQFNTLLKELQAYKESQKDGSCEEKWSQLDNLELLTKDYLKTKQGSLNAALEKKLPPRDDVERAYRRIDACNLLLRGIDVARFDLEGKVIGGFDSECGFIPRRGIRFRPENMLEYHSQFAAGMISSVDRFKTHDGSEFIFKEESSLEELPAEISEKLGLPKGTTKKGAKFAGRSLATYKIDDLLGSRLVPRVGFTALGAEGKERRGHFQELAKGEQLWKEEATRLSDQELRAVFGNNEAIVENLVHLAMGGSSDHDVARLHFPNFLVQVSPQKPLLENGEPISNVRAIELAQSGALYFEAIHSKKISYVNQQIDFSDPHLQRSLANAQLLHFITGELDPNPLNFVYTSDSSGNPMVAVIDSDISFPDDFDFPTSLQDTEDPAAINLEFQKIIKRKNAKQVRELPVLIDAEMGESILDIDDLSVIDEVLQGTGLTQAEIIATKNRVTTLQHYIKLIKATVGYATWGNATYESAKNDPAHTYLGYFSEALEFTQQEYKGQLRHRINALEQPVVLTPEEQAELREAKEKLVELESPRPMIQKMIEKVIEKAVASSSSSHADAAVERGSYAGSAFSTASKRSTTTLQSFFAAADDIGKQRYRPGQRSKWIPSLSTIFDSRHTSEVHTPTLRFNANKIQLRADRKEYLAGQAVAAAEQKISCNSSLEETHSLWQAATRKLFEAEDACEAVITAYAEESPVRHNLLATAKAKKENLIPNILWAQVHQAESAAALALEGAKKTSAPIDWEKVVDRLVQAQQAWRVLLSHLAAPLAISPATWEKSFSIANAATSYSEFFPYWAKAAEQRYQSLTAPLFQDSQNHSTQERTLWHSLAHKTREMVTATGHGENLLQEVEAQKAYARAQEASMAVDFFKKNVSELAEIPIIKTANTKGWFADTPWIHDIRILGVDEKKLGELCSHWNDLVAATMSTESSLQAVVQVLDKLPVILSSSLRHEKIFDLKDEKLALASYQINTEETERFMTLGKVALLANERSLAREKLLEAKALCDKTAASFNKDEVFMWRPIFPSIEVITGSHTTREWQIVGGGPHEATERDWVEVTHYHYNNLTPMRLFLSQLESHYPNCLRFKNSLQQMLDGTSDSIKEKWDATTQTLKKVRAEIDASLQRLAQLQTQKEN